MPRGASGTRVPGSVRPWRTRDPSELVQQGWTNCGRGGSLHVRTLEGIRGNMSKDMLIGVVRVPML